jgi:hypothetical protein
MLEKVEMPPLLLDSVVHRTGGYPAVWATEPRANLEIHT